MFNLDSVKNENNKNHNKNGLIFQIIPIECLIIGGSGSGKINALLNLKKEQDSDELIDKIYLYAKDLNEPKYQFLIKLREDVGTKHLNDPKAFIEYSAYVDDVCNNINDNNQNRKTKFLIVFDDMIADIMTKKKFQAMIKELFIRCRKLEYI